MPPSAVQPDVSLKLVLNHNGYQLFPKCLIRPSCSTKVEMPWKLTAMVTVGDCHLGEDRLDTFQKGSTNLLF